MIGIIGQGFVGNAVYQKFKNFYDILTYDIDKEKCNSTLDNLIFKSETIFVCLPTPMNKDGSCDTSILNESLSNIDLVADNLETIKTIIIKSTIPPGTTDKFNKQYEYAYHFDATKFGLWLKNNYCIPKGVKHIQEDIKTIEQNEDGITSLNNKYKADLYALG